ncbi:chorismate-binding protein [Isoptericola sp. b441]|uniref:Chorismate-binding protein n=1 Tax=Actinotalea lenta TaxID=3064654 RepID=A0ABT9DAA1_9CELL|nr:chorismate-binding protein [Isoptericola sp. b441]MDO8107837.1 chorismate-binding protein [Isoptericola sp. b441]
MTRTVLEAGGDGWAVFGGRRAHQVVDHVDLRLDRVTEGFWAVVAEFEGPARAWRFAEVERYRAPGGPPMWRGPRAGEWTTSLDRAAYVEGVRAVRRAIRDGDVYQVNLCRVLSAPLAPAAGEPDAAALAARLSAGNPAPYSGALHVPGGGDHPAVWIVTASPELFLRIGDGWITSGPIKGTAATIEGLTAKDAAENVMIADMVRNDLQRVCLPGTVEVTRLLEVEPHPGLVHLVTTVRGALTDATWPAVLRATFPPASVSGAPKHAALDLIASLEPVPRGPYCGAVGWIDADERRAELAVGIRTFWWAPEGGGVLRFGTGAGITWDSDPDAEWAETELKAARLVGLASR